MDTPANEHEALLAIVRCIHDAPSFDAWSLRFHDPVLRNVYRLAASQLDRQTCQTLGLPTWEAIAEAEKMSANAGHLAPSLPADSLPEPWTKTTGEML